MQTLKCCSCDGAAGLSGVRGERAGSQAGRARAAEVLGEVQCV